MDRGTIQDFWARCKAILESLVSEWGLILVIFLATFSAFGLGRLSATESARPVVTVGEAAHEEAPLGMAVGGLMVASRTGSVYHYPWCSGGSNIKPENQVWFANEEAAQAAGYTPSKNCDGLGK